MAALDWQFGQWGHDRKAKTLPLLAEALKRHLHGKGMEHQLNDRLKDAGWRFENGGFVPVDAHGEIAP